MSAPRLISAATAAERLGVSTRTLRRYTADGTLPERRSPGGRRVFDTGELDRLSARRGDLPKHTGAVVLYARVSSHRQRAGGIWTGSSAGSERRLGPGRWRASSSTSRRACRTNARRCAGR